MLAREDLIPDSALRQDEEDAFDYGAIALQMASLCLHVDTPANIALFGPWGSGKTSFFELLRRGIESRAGADACGLIRYDAWRHGGSSLRRNFISDVATQLGYTGQRREFRQYHRGLYQSRKTIDIDLRELFRAQATGILLWLLAAVSAGVFFAFLIALVSGGSAELLDEFGRLVPRFGAPLAAVLFAAGSLLKLFDGARVEVNEDAPSSDEQFSATFRRLITRARSRVLLGGKGYSRLVFFIDELDRCRPTEVVETLSAVKAFLGQENCIFIVAMDRAVLERALGALPQATPADEDDPYYSSAGAFVDKIFQYQVSLPPLRMVKLTRFARDLVETRGGIWAELREQEEGERLLDRIIYALIPSHVRSPRRVKILLNNFALAARIAQSRGLDWVARAEEIAKLTVLQTEFPALARDLHKEPKLPSLLLREYDESGKNPATSE